MAYAIRYRYPGTESGKPVGFVYAQNIDDLSPGCWSYSKDLAQATWFGTWQSAEDVRTAKPWPESSVVEIPTVDRDRQA